MRPYAYREVQLARGPWVGLFIGLFIALPVARHADPSHSIISHIMIWTGFVVALLMAGRLVIEVDSSELRWSFGWLGWQRKRVALADIVRVEPAAMHWCEGWGVRLTREGMLYNLSGRQTMRIVCRDGRQLRLGSQDPGRLIAAVTARLPVTRRPD